MRLEYLVEAGKIWIRRSPNIARHLNINSIEPDRRSVLFPIFIPLWRVGKEGDL